MFRCAPAKLRLPLVKIFKEKKEVRAAASVGGVRDAAFRGKGVSGSLSSTGYKKSVLPIGQCQYRRTD